MTYENILYSVEDNIATITLHRPDKLNAFTFDMLSELLDVFDRIDADDDVRAVIVTGAGRGFCAGADLSNGSKTFDYDNRPDRDPGAPSPVRPDGSIDWTSYDTRDTGGILTLRIYDCTKPVIAAINGPAVGVGASMLLPMDIRIASRTARFGFVFTRRGIVPESNSSWFLPRVVGIAQALEWCLTGRVFGAEEAAKTRLVSQVVEPDALLDTARSIAREIVDNTAPVSIALTRQMLWKLLGADHPMEAHKLESRMVYTRGRSNDSREGVASFLDKRQPAFPDKVSDGLPDFYPWWDDHEY